jgi:phosphoglycerate dehydrogenase-like enzyme
MPQIVVPDDDPPAISPSTAFKRLAGHDVRVHTSRLAGIDELIERIADAEFVINVRARTPFTRDVLERCRNLKLISIWGTGTDNIDLPAAKQLGIRVANTPGVSAIAVAEHTIMLMLAVAHRIVEVDRQVRGGQWPRALVSQVHGKTVGLIGTGAIGKEVARFAAGLGCRVIAWTFHPHGDFAEWVAFDDVFRRSDIVSVHLRQTAETTGMIGREHFEMMKPGAMFVNTARGAIIREQDLIEALRSGRIGGAGLDVFDKEPLPPDSPFFSLPNTVLTPHAAHATPEASEAGIALAIENIFSFMAGNPRNVVV